MCEIYIHLFSSYLDIYIISSKQEIWSIEKCAKWLEMYYISRMTVLEDLAPSGVK